MSFIKLGSGGVRGKPLMVQPLSSGGDGSGVISMVGNYASAAAEFYLAPAAGEVFAISRILVSITDVGTFDADSYGNGIVLTNGIDLEVDYGSFTQTLTAAGAIKTNSDWAKYCYDVDLSAFGTGDEYLHARWTFSKFGQSLVLVGSDNHRLVARLNDDFTGLVDHQIICQGLVMRGNLTT